MTDREKVIKALERCQKRRIIHGVACLECPYAEAEGGTDDWCVNGLYRDALALLEEQPQIVRCEDCKHGCGRGHGIYCQFIECEKTGAFRKDDWFCADGERRI